VLPIAAGPFVATVRVLVGLYALMGLGLNVVVGFAGLLDLGYVAFFAIGAYTTALLTSTGTHGIAEISFWAAVPIAMAMSLLAGVLLGIPVLGIRGDYLAIATLGFGEIIRLLVLSDFLRPWLGGSQGVLAVPKPALGAFELGGPGEIFYLTLASCAILVFVATRLRNSRLGRAWMAMREDEDVAQAMGINLVNTKLLAFGLGATFGGLSGAIFAVLVGSVFPHSFQLLISINVLALIIVGGMGSMPGVIVGALVLVGLPELLREFSDFRFLVYGAALVYMMRRRPEGLWPAATIRRELHTAE
jgi:branched-chain amino acid transport system permease protein